MPFMLLVRGPDDDVRLLSDVSFATRKDALDELARQTSDPAFSDWDAEVFVVDIDQATPVLLVRPSAEHEPTEQRVVSTQDEPEAEALHDDPDLTAVLRKLAEEEDAGPSGVEEAALNLVSAAATVEAVDPAWADAVMSTVDEPDGSDDEVLVEVDDAIEPESPAIVPAERSVRQVVEQAAAEFEASGVRVPMSVRAPDAVEESGSAEDEAEAEDTEEDSSAALESPSPSTPWPWSEQPADVAEPDILLGLDEPLAEAEEPPEEAKEPPTQAEEQDAEAERPETPGAEPDEAGTSDFIELDEATIPEPPAIEPPGYRSEDAAAQAGMSCEDCIYVETCPHKGEQDPASCGSFQWR